MTTVAQTGFLLPRLATGGMSPSAVARMKQTDADFKLAQSLRPQLKTFDISAVLRAMTAPVQRVNPNLYNRAQEIFGLVLQLEADLPEFQQDVIAVEYSALERKHEELRAIARQASKAVDDSREPIADARRDIETAVKEFEHQTTVMFSLRRNRPNPDRRPFPSAKALAEHDALIVAQQRNVDNALERLNQTKNELRGYEVAEAEAAISLDDAEHNVRASAKRLELYRPNTSTRKSSLVGEFGLAG